MTALVDNHARVLETHDSSVLSDMEYNYSTNRLTIKFNSGSVWQYDDVPIDIWNTLQTAESVGATFNYLVRGHYVGYKLNVL